MLQNDPFSFFNKILKFWLYFFDKKSEYFKKKIFCKKRPIFFDFFGVFMVILPPEKINNRIIKQSPDRPTRVQDQVIYIRETKTK